MSDERSITLSMTITERWMYDALLYGKETADFAASVRTAIEVLPAVRDGEPSDDSAA